MINIPKHIAIIMDGNGRWATKRGLTRPEGHIAGAKAIKKVVQASIDFNIKYLTLFAFSTENFNRPDDEVQQIMNLIIKYCKNELKNLLEDDIKVVFLGDKSKLQKKVQDAMIKVENMTENCASMRLNICINYSGRSDVLNAVNTAVRLGKEVDEKSFDNLLYTKGCPNPDLIIRTGGEKRLSNFLLYQASYSELLFLDKYWPDFNKKTLEKAILDYSNRNRRFGAIEKEN